MFNKILKKLYVFVLVVVSLFGGVFSCLSKKNTVGVELNPQYLHLALQMNKPESFVDWIVELISPIFGIEQQKEVGFQEKTEVVAEQKYVYVSGKPIGFSLSSCGSVVVETSVVNAETGEMNPLRDADIMPGDIIVKIENESVCAGADIIQIVNRLAPEKASLSVSVRRGDKVVDSIVYPAFDKLTGSYRLGLWVRDNAVGVGTMTYVDEENKFYALGHPVVDIDTGVVIPANNGELYKCSIVGVNKGKRGIAGDLKGLFLQSKNGVGCIEMNTESGLVGRLSDGVQSEYKGEKCRIASVGEVEIGYAKILSTIDGGTPQYYDIEIVKTNYVNQQGRNCMIIKVVDEKLIEKTGGIVQGMSGSPVIQNGNLVGCVTHVFVNDPTRGFADFVG